MKLRLLLIPLCLALPASAVAADTSACTASLSPAARMIFDKVQAAPANGTLRDRVVAQTRALVQAGRLNRSDARPAAREAGACLKAQS